MDKCSAFVQGDFNRYQCSKNGKVERDGKSYCGTHDPVAVKAKQAAKNVKWDAENKAEQAKWRDKEKREKAIAKLCGHIPTDELENYELVTRASSSTQGAGNESQGRK